MRRRTMSRLKGLSVLVAVAATFTSGCNPYAKGDCTARVRWEDRIYRPWNELATSTAHPSLSLGTADVVDCGGVEDASKVAEVGVFTIKGVNPDEAVVTKDKTYGGVIYVVEGLGPSEWSPGLVRYAKGGR
jgi:hypothetical protein